MSLRRLAFPVLGALALLALPQPVSANLCVLLAPGQRAADEADAVRAAFGVMLPDDPATAVNESARLVPRREYNARLIHCNRQRDANGEDIEAAIRADHVFAVNLEPRTVKGHYQYGPAFNLRYAYQIERDGAWIVTVPIRFHWPDARMTDMVDIPMELAADLGLARSGEVCAIGSTVLEGRSGNRDVVRGPILDAASSDPSIGNKDRMYYPGSAACRVNRNRIVDNKSVLNHVRDYWTKEISGIWDRDNFSIRPVFIDCEEPPGNSQDSCGRVSETEMSAWVKDETIWDVHFNLDPNHRPAFKRFVGKWNNMHTGVDGETVGHELGHYLGLDDEYDLLPSNLPLTPQYFDVAANFLDFDCRQFNPDADENYIMCAHTAGRQGAQGVYPWLITRRYAIARAFQCRADTDCDGNEYCDKGWATIGRNQCLPRLAQGERCERTDQCVARAACKGLPLDGRCVIEASVALNGACIHDSQCTTGSCGNTSRVCQCREDGHCPQGSYCAEGFITIGQNSCQSAATGHSELPGGEWRPHLPGRQVCLGTLLHRGGGGHGRHLLRRCRLRPGQVQQRRRDPRHLRVRRRRRLRLRFLVRPGRRHHQEQLQREVRQGRGLRHRRRTRRRPSLHVRHLHGGLDQARQAYLQIGAVFLLAAPSPSWRRHCGRNGPSRRR